MWEVPLETQQSEFVTNNILAQTSKPKLAQYLYAELFIPTTASLLKFIKHVFLTTGQVLTEKPSIGILKNQGTQQWDTCT